MANTELANFFTSSNSHFYFTYDAIPYPGVRMSLLLAMTRHDHTRPDLIYRDLTKDEFDILKILPQTNLLNKKKHKRE